jgi:hypothetical protein
VGSKGIPVGFMNLTEKVDCDDALHGRVLQYVGVAEYTNSGKQARSALQIDPQFWKETRQPSRRAICLSYFLESAGTFPSSLLL